MEHVIDDDKNIIVMKLLHYFITEKNYNPIILQGAENEIWLENMDSDYEIVRIVSNHIHNEEQFQYDLFKTKHIVKKIKRKTFTLNMNVLSIFTDVRDEASVSSEKHYDCISIDTEKDINKYKNVIDYFPDITKKLQFNEDGVQLFLKITSDINKKNKKDQDEAESVFSKKKPIITNVLIVINVLVYFLMLLFDASEYVILRFGTVGIGVIEYHQVYRLITGAFIHENIFHLIFNCYALFIIGSQMESFLGRTKYLIVYLVSAICGSLLAIVMFSGFTIGASGAIFGLLGSLLYFGYHYRVYLGTVIKSQIIPLIIINLAIGFMLSKISNAAHIGGLVGGVLITMALGVKYKSKSSEKINGFVLLTMFIVFLTFLAIRFVK